MKVNWTGVFPAVTTKFTDDEKLDIDAMERHFSFQIDAGVHGLVVIGSLGENGMRINSEEIFGNVAGVIRVKNYEEALAVANDTPFGLCAGICTASLKLASHFKHHAQAGW